MASIPLTKRDVPGDARQIRSRAALSGALLDLLEEKPFDQLTIREISSRAGTGYATFFRHYPDKETLLDDVASVAIAGLLAMTLPMLDSANRRASTRALCHHVDRHRTLWAALLTGGAAGIVRQKFIAQARLLLDSRPVPHNWLPADLAVTYVAGSTIDLLSWWLSQGDGIDPDAMAAILYRLVIGPLTRDGA